MRKAPIIKKALKSCIMCADSFFPLESEEEQKPVCESCKIRIASLSHNANALLVEEIKRLNAVIQELENGVTPT